MASVCTATKRNGEACTLPANGQQGLCWAHDPKNAQARRRGASRGGKAKANREITSIKKQLEDLTEDVLEDRVERGAAVVVNQIINTRVRLIELERKVREQDELLQRIEALEASTTTSVRPRRGGMRW